MQIKSKYALFVAGALSLMLLAWRPASAQQSVAYQINPEHDGATTFPEGFNLPLQKVWSRKFPVDMGQINDVAYPVIVGDKVFVAVTDLRGTTVEGTQLLALSLHDGRQLWRRAFQYRTHSYWNALAYDKGRLFVMTGQGFLFALDAQTGSTLWRTSIRDVNTWSFDSPPTAYNGKVYVSGQGYSGTLFAVDQVTGKITWKKRVKNGGAGSPTASSSGVHVAYGCKVYNFAPFTGTLRWFHDGGGCSGGIGNTAPLHLGRIYANGVTSFTMMSFDARTGAKIHALKNVLKPPAFYNGIGYFVTYSSGLVAWSSKTNKVLWQEFVGVEPALPPIVVNGKVVTLSYGAILYVLDGMTGKILQELPLGGHVTPNGEISGGMRKGMAAGEGMLIAITDDTVVALKPAP